MPPSAPLATFGGTDITRACRLSELLRVQAEAAREARGLLGDRMARGDLDIMPAFGEWVASCVGLTPASRGQTDHDGRWVTGETVSVKSRRYNSARRINSRGQADLLLVVEFDAAGRPHIVYFGPLERVIARRNRSGRDNKDRPSLSSLRMTADEAAVVAALNAQVAGLYEGAAEAGGDHSASGPSHATPADEFLVWSARAGVTSRLAYRDGAYVWLAGSTAAGVGARHWRTRRRTRDELIRRGLLQPAPRREQYLLVSDVTCARPSAITCMALGREANGYDEARLTTDRTITLRDWLSVHAPHALPPRPQPPVTLILADRMPPNAPDFRVSPVGRPVS